MNLWWNWSRCRPQRWAVRQCLWANWDLLADTTVVLDVLLWYVHITGFKPGTWFYFASHPAGVWVETQVFCVWQSSIFSNNSQISPEKFFFPWHTATKIQHVRCASPIPIPHRGTTDCSWTSSGTPRRATRCPCFIRRWTKRRCAEPSGNTCWRRSRCRVGGGLDAGRSDVLRVECGVFYG